MPKIMNRGKQQILFNLLPNRTFDFEKIYTIASVVEIRGSQPTNINTQILMQRIAREVYAWEEDNRPALRDDVLRQLDRFVFLEPNSVQSKMFPKVLWCQNHLCHRVFDFTNQNSLPNKCPACKTGRLIQLRWVKIHRCGELLPLTPPRCTKCNSSFNMSLETRGSERISSFRWICRTCNTKSPVYAGNCNNCNLTDPKLRRMDIEVHRAGRTFYAHTTVLLNIPQRSLDGLFRIHEWTAIVAAKFFNMPEVARKTIVEYGQNTSTYQAAQSNGLSGDDLDILFAKQASGELTPDSFMKAMQSLREQRQQENNANSPSGIFQLLIQRSGVSKEVWDRAGQEVLETIMPIEIGNPKILNLKDPDYQAAVTAQKMGLSKLILVSDYPIITATYGFSRAEYHPNDCRLNPFPAMREHNGKYPIFIDQVHADALLISLSHERVLRWLTQNGCQPSIPDGSDRDIAMKAYFVQLFDQINLRETLSNDQREVRMVFGLLHTLSHLSIRQAGLLCGLDRTSLSEYLLPPTLTFAIYCNHRFGATIGALTALYEQSLSMWLNTIHETRRCVYDPICREKSGNCHACSHLPETSCRFFNLNLSRAFLFGGFDSILGEIPVGFFDTSL